MLTRVELEQLSNYRNPDYPVTSFYINIDRGSPDESAVMIRLKNILAEGDAQRHRWNKEQLESIEQDFERIRAFVRDQYVRGGQGLVAFSCSADKFWQTYVLPDRVGNSLHLDHQPYLKPLHRLLAKYQPICTVLVGKSKARLFIIRGESIEERSDIFSDIPKRHDQGGWAQARLQRQHDEAVTHHLKTTAEQTFALFREVEFGKLLVAGTEELVSQFKESLHPYLAERFVASFPLSMVAGPKTVLQRTQRILRELEARENETLVTRLEDEVGAKNLGVAGLRNTIWALEQGQVLTLLVEEGFSEPGKRCLQCGHYSVRAEEACFYCGGELSHVADIVQALMDMAFDQECEVRVIDGPAGERLAKLGHIGALLRFKVSE